MKLQIFINLEKAQELWGNRFGMCTSILINETNFSKDQFNFNRQKDQQERKKNEIGFSSIRGGNIPGEHTVIFHGENESIELTHRAFNREIFADGAIEAAIWLSKQKSGYYTYKDMF